MMLADESKPTMQTKPLAAIAEMNSSSVAMPCLMMNDFLAGFCCVFSRLNSQQI